MKSIKNNSSPKWITGAEIKQGDTIAVATQHGEATLVNFEIIEKGMATIKVFDINNQWTTLENPVSMEEIEEFNFVRIN